MVEGGRGKGLGPRLSYEFVAKMKYLDLKSTPGRK